MQCVSVAAEIRAAIGTRFAPPIMRYFLNADHRDESALLFATHGCDSFVGK
jgi:hypothetical protein